MKLIPNKDKLDFLRQDYLNMSGMFFRDTPNFDDIVEEIFTLERIINKL